MATFEISADIDVYMKKAEEILEKADDLFKETIYEGANVIADAMKEEMKKIPIDKGRALKEGEKFTSATQTQINDLEESMGVAPIKSGIFGWNTKVGFDGYGRYKTGKYKKGVPNALTARSIESGSTIRVKYPFVRNAVSKSNRKSIEAMDKAFNMAIQKICKK